MIRTLGCFLLALLAMPLLAAPVLIGSFNVYDGPQWTTDPQVMNAQQVAAMLYGGSPSDYSISVSPSTITLTAWLDGWGDTTYLTTPAPQNYSLSSEAGGGYNLAPSFSAWVCDHADCAAYGFPVNAPQSGSNFNYTNYVFRDAAVPEPASWALLGAGGFALFIRRRRLPSA